MPTFAEAFLFNPNVSMESLIEGIAEREIEYTLYVRLDNIEELKRLAIRTERHEQWNIPTAKPDCATKERIRLIDNLRPTQCVKTKDPSKVGVEEVEDDITMDMFVAKRRMAVDGYFKTRYTLATNIRGLMWEVDVFYTNGGDLCPWVKVDLEVKSLNDPIPLFPLAHTRVIYADDELSFTDRAQVKKLWEEEWQKIDVKKF